MRQAMLGNALVDLRNIYPETTAQEAGFIYYGLGRAAQAERPHRERRADNDADLRRATT
jgi:hypothetical protein